MVKNQHYIPQFYQKYWECERKGYLWTLNKKYSKQGIRQHSIRRNCSDEYTYEDDIENPDNAFEHWYGVFETKYAPQYANFINGRFCLQRVSLKQKEMICLLYAHFSARNKTNVYENTKNRFIASHFTLGFENKIVDNRCMLNMVALANGGTIEGTTSGFAKELMTFKMQILISDKPNIVFSDSIIQQIHYSEEYFFPLCPTMVARFTKSGETVDREIKRITDDEYSRFIDLYTTSTYVWQLFASNKDTLEEIRKKYIFCCVEIPIPSIHLHSTNKH